MTEKEKKIQTYLRRALIYTEDIEKDENKKIVVIENIKLALDLINKKPSCGSSCDCKGKIKFDGDIEE